MMENRTINKPTDILKNKVNQVSTKSINRSTADKIITMIMNITSLFPVGIVT